VKNAGPEKGDQKRTIVGNCRTVEHQLMRMENAGAGNVEPNFGKARK